MINSYRKINLYLKRERELQKRKNMMMMNLMIITMMKNQKGTHQIIDLKRIINQSVSIQNEPIKLQMIGKLRKRINRMQVQEGLLKKRQRKTMKKTMKKTKTVKILRLRSMIRNSFMILRSQLEGTSPSNQINLLRSFKILKMIQRSMK